MGHSIVKVPTHWKLGTTRAGHCGQVDQGAAVNVPLTTSLPSGR
ncbi:MAG: hypothetical protein ACI8PZ_002064 [Myxococcota bacterium]|jgi:hypothetical protein